MAAYVKRFLLSLKTGSLREEEQKVKQDRKWKHLHMKYSTVAGSVLILAPNGLFIYWNNLSVYSLSYLVCELDSTSGLESTWVLSAFLIFWTLMTMLSGFVARRIGGRCTALVGAIIADLGLSMSHFTVQYSLLALTFTLGLVHGFGTGLIDGSVLQLVMEWADNDTGKLSAGIQAAQAFGAFIINQFVTFYLNPRNLTPNLRLAQSKYFTQTEVIERVPTIFLILAAVALSIHILGFCLLRKRPKEGINKEQTVADTNDVSKGQCLQMQKRFAELETMPINTNGAVYELPVSSSDNDRRAKEIQNYTPREMLRTKSFYAVWITFFMGSMSFILVNNYSKSFGQLWIADDNFLTYLGTALIITDAVLSLLWGVAIDKFGVKSCFIFYMTALALSQVWYCFTAMLSRWLFFVSTVVIGSFVSSIYSCYTAAIAILYGKSYVGTNFGILMTGSLSFAVIAPFIFENALRHLGWFSIFAMAASLNIIRLVLVIIFIPSV